MALSPGRTKTIEKFNRLRIPLRDVPSLRGGEDGMIMYACGFGCNHENHNHDKPQGSARAAGRSLRYRPHV